MVQQFPVLTYRVLSQASRAFQGAFIHEAAVRGGCEALPGQLRGWLCLFTGQRILLVSLR